MKVSVSLDRKAMAVLKRRARDLHAGNLSAAFAEAAAWMQEQETRRHLLELLGGTSLAPDAAAAIDAEQAGGPRYEPKKVRSKRAA